MSDSIFEQKKAKYLEANEKKLLADHFDKTHSAGTAMTLEDGTPVKVAGRVVARRKMGKVVFLSLFDFDGKVQLFFKKNAEKPEDFDNFNEWISIGDFIGIEGEMFTTKTGEKTVRVGDWKLLNKSLRTLPEKFHGLEDIESRYRQRYLDIIMNEDSRRIFQKRIKLVKNMRHFLEENHFLEVETPVLQTKPSGALARPFYTKHNALDIECSLRIAPETWLKRLIGAGMDRVYEFSRCFRNEGISATHLQDFTMLEFYAAYWNADIQREYVQKLIKYTIENTFEELKVKIGEHEVDFAGDWPVYDYSELILKDCGIDIRKHKDKSDLLAVLKEKGIEVEDAETLSWGNLVDGLYKKVTRPKLIQPCFLVRYPTELAPLARRNAEDPDFVDRFQFVVAGAEIVNAYSELVDPVDQRGRFEEQAEARVGGDDEAMPLDEEYLISMEHGFPPISGVGIGIDRLVMVLCGCENIKDTVLFPLLRPQH